MAPAFTTFYYQVDVVGFTSQMARQQVVPSAMKQLKGTDVLSSDPVSLEAAGFMVKIFRSLWN